MTKYVHIMQHDEKDCGAACLAMISGYYKLKLPITKFRELIKVDNQGANIYGIVQGAKQLGFDSDALEGNYSELIEFIQNKELEFPFIARILNEEGYEHYITVYAYDGNTFTIADPGRTKIIKISAEIFQQQWLGQIIIFVPTEKFQKDNQTKGCLSKFFRYIFAEKKTMAIIAVMTVLISVINMFGTTIFQYVIDGMSGENTADTSGSMLQVLISKISVLFGSFDKVCITVLCMYLLKLFVNIIRSYMLAGTSVRIDFRMTADLFRHLIKLPFAFFGTRKTGEIISRFDNLSEIRDVLSSATFTLLLDTGMAIAFGILLFLMSPLLFLITMISVILYGIVLFVFKSHIKAANHACMEDSAHVTSHLKESIDGIEVIKANQYENSAQDKLEQLADKFEKKAFHLSMLNASQSSIVSLLDSAAIVILMWAGSYLCASGNLSVGGLFAYYYMMHYFLNPISNLIQLQPTMQSAIVAAERLNDILDAEPEKKVTGDVVDSINDILIQNLAFAYGNRGLVLDNLNMEIKKGQKIAVVGESGCGKTTLAKLLMRFYDYESGSILINGREITEFDIDSLRQHCVYISQNTFLFSDSIRNNLTMGADISDDEIKHVCQLCRADEFISKMPSGYDSVLEENGSNLSGGQRQRLAIARALLRHPDVVIMDEATSNLDSITEKSIQAMIDDISNDITCIIIAHRLKTIKNCDYIYVLKDGKVCEQGTHDELIALNKTYASYWCE